MCNFKLHKCLMMSRKNFSSFKVANITPTLTSCNTEVKYTLYGLCSSVYNLLENEYTLYIFKFEYPPIPP